MDERVELSELILKVYDTALDPGRWPAVLHRAARYIGGRGAFIFEIEGQGTARRIRAPFFSESYDGALVEHYLDAHVAQELADQDEFARCSRMTDAIHLIPDNVLASSEAELLARPNMREMLSYNIRYRAGALLNKDRIAQDRFAVQFAPDDGPINQQHLDRAALIMPHIAKALDVSRPVIELRRQGSALLGSLDNLVVGMAILDQRGRIVLTNTEFERQLRECNAFRKDAGGGLQMRSADDARAFFNLTADLAHHGRFGGRPRKEAVVTSTGSGQVCTLCVEVAPLQRADELGEPRLLGHAVYSMDTSRGYAIDTAILTDLFQLTKAEAAVLELMAEGLTNAQISDRRGKSVETVNSQVKAILDKTNSANRTQAIRLAASISSSFFARPEAQKRTA